MKKFNLGLLIILFFVLAAVPVLAEESATSTGNVKPSLKERLQSKIQATSKADTARVKVLERVRNSVGVRWNVFNKALGRSDNLLGKLQLRIDKAKEAGKDTKEAESLMEDALKNLTDAKEKLDEIKDLKGSAMDREGFQNIQAKFKVIQRDLHTVKIDASKIIRILKGFNSATSSGKNPQATSSSTND